MMDTLDIIYIEDDDQEAFIMRVGMRRQGMNILHVADLTADTIATLLAPPYDRAVALIFDAILGGESGVNLASRLRLMGDSRPIFLLTAGENPDAELLKQHQIRYLRKPPHFENLARTVRELTAG
ncbi:MAG: hypothetical protein K8J31_23555 [Anaerolineae bacterium]|nr:hypothetical protein [Anaerolineae bacterium]